MKTTYGGSGGIAPPVSTSALDGREWSAQRPGRYTPGKYRRYPLDMRLGAPQSRTGRYAEDGNLVLTKNQTPSLQILFRHYADWAVPTVGVRGYLTTFIAIFSKYTGWNDKATTGQKHRWLHRRKVRSLTYRGPSNYRRTSKKKNPLQ
jgi:hypothetical protein